MLTARVRMSQARVELEAGRPGEAQALYASVLEPLRQAGRPGVPLAAQALVGRGEALLALGRAAEAVAPLREAVALREPLMWERGWELALARVRLGEALKRSGGAGASELLARGLVDLEAQLGSEHPQVARVKALIAS